MDSKAIAEQSEILRQIVEASDVISKKHKMIRTYRDDTERTTGGMFQLIVRPLQSLVNPSMLRNRIKSEPDKSTELIKSGIQPEVQQVKTNEISYVNQEDYYNNDVIRPIRDNVDIKNRKSDFYDIGINGSVVSQ